MKLHPLVLFFVLSLIKSQLLAQQARTVPLDPVLENYEYPFPVKFVTLSIQQATYRMAYMDLAPDRWNGKSVLLFHGKNFSGAYWQRTAESLQKEGYRVIMPDQLGFGKSSKPSHFQYSFHALAQNTRNLLDSLQVRRAMVVGHSMGGMLAVVSL